MKVFLSWSGDLSHRVALVLREWIPSVIQAVKPYVSSEDIDKGSRWSIDIAQELESSTFGILCVTAENLHAPWMNFEAGALSKTLNQSLVCPFLIDLRRSQVQGPLLQFQSTLYEEEEIRKLLYTINSACEEPRLDTTRLDKAFEIWWPSLKNELDDCIKQPKTADASPAQEMKDDSNSEILEEILELVREQRRLERHDRINPAAIRDLRDCYESLMDLIEGKEDPCSLPLESIRKALSDLGRPVRYFIRTAGARPFARPASREVATSASD